MKGREIEDQLTLYGLSSASRLLLGTARYDSPSLLADAISRRRPCHAHGVSAPPALGLKEFWAILLESASRDAADDPT